MDGTLTKQGTFTVISKTLGFWDRFQELRDKWIAGKLSLCEFNLGAARLLSGVREEDVLDAIGGLELADGAAELSAFLSKRGVKQFIITGAVQHSCGRVAKLLKIRDWVSNEYEVAGGRFTGRIANHFVSSPRDKVAFMEKFASSNGFSLDETIAVGDSRIDSRMLEEAAVGIAVNPKDEKIREAANFVVEKLSYSLPIFRGLLPRG